MKRLTFIHAADLHLDSPFKGLQMSLPSFIFERMKESSFRSLQKIVDTALREKVDFLLFSGDLFDSETRSLRAQSFFREQMKRLLPYGIQVYAIHGNHDYIGGSGTVLDLPENVHIFTQPYVETKSFYKDGELTANLYGFSYHQKAVIESMVSQYKKQGDAPFHIGLLHGSAEGENEHSRYAPFRAADLAEKGFDYWALGHIHKRQILCTEPPVVYPGNIQGRHRKETGDKGCYMVSLSAAQSVCTFVPTADIVWEELHISIHGLDTIDELLRVCSKKINEVRREKEGVLLSVIFTGYGKLAAQLESEAQLEEVVQILMQEEERDDFVYIVKYENRTLPYESREQLKRDAFLGSVIETIDSFQDMKTVLAPLYMQPVARKVLNPFTEEEQAEIMAEAERLLLQELLKE
jgi:exonuclease SbcD